MGEVGGCSAGRRENSQVSVLWLLWEIDREREAWVKVAEVHALVISGEKKKTSWVLAAGKGCFGRPSLNSGAKFHLVIYFLFSHAVTKEKAIYPFLILSLLSSLSNYILLPLSLDFSLFTNMSNSILINFLLI